jgi:NADPH-dependent 2,4-dienoyl-CoA reductase/sulfur reductase-like enzyme
MADRRVDYLMIGGGIASATAARTLRESGADGSILLVGREPDPPYHRPPVSKGYLQDKETREDIAIHPADWWESSGVELLTRTSVLALDPALHTATLSTKETVEYGQALLATGAMVRRLNVDGSQLEGIHYLRVPGNADAVREHVIEHDHVLMVGGSYIGCEVAASLTEMGKRCTVVMQETHTLERHFGQQAGRFFQSTLEDRGVAVFGSEEVERFEGDDRVARLVTKSGRTIEATAVVAGVGAIPDVMLARKAGLELGELGGVRTNSRLETSAPDLYAAGDICEYDSVIHGRPLRIEHEDVAAQHGRTAALNMLGRDVAHDTVPYFFSDLSNWVSLEYVGPASDWDSEIIRGSIEDGEFSIWYLEGGRVAAALAVGRSEDLDHARRLIADRRQIEDPSVLADLAADLATA